METPKIILLNLPTYFYGMIADYMNSFEVQITTTPDGKIILTAKPPY